MIMNIIILKQPSVFPILESALFAKAELISETEKTEMTKHAMKVQTASLRGLEHCRALEIGVENMAECLQKGPNSCSYAMPFGYCFLCKHPRLDEIIENTKKAKVSGEFLN